jgi:antitoxin component YwqK of YwqJK toxin-antitoxin module
MRQNIIRKILLLVVVCLFFSNCNFTIKQTPLNKEKLKIIDGYNRRLFNLTKIDSKQVLDSLERLSDNIFTDTGHYFRTPKATLYINTQAKTKNQVFENPKGTITAIGYYRGEKQINMAEYYSNGQIMCMFTVDEDGVRNGNYYCYYEDGSFRMTGKFSNGNEIRDSFQFFKDTLNK